MWLTEIISLTLSGTPTNGSFSLMDDDRTMGAVCGEIPSDSDEVAVASSLLGRYTCTPST